MNLSKLPFRGFFLFKTPPLWKFKFRLRCSFKINIGLKDPSPYPSNLQWPSIGWAWIFSGTTLVVISVVNSLSLWTGLRSRGKTGDQEKREGMQETITFTEKRKLILVIQIQGALWRKLDNLKPLFNHNEEICVSKGVKENALASEGK